MLPPVLAEIKRTSAKKSLAGDSCQGDHGCMFSVHCAGHGTRVLLSERAITSLTNTDHGIELHWRCLCGTEGVELLGRLAEPQFA
jgi:hypothetical protein